MGDRLIMSEIELKRKAVLERVLCGKLKLTDAATQLGVSYRQAKRIKERYKIHKDKGLVHGNRGKKPSNVYKDSYKQQILDLYLLKYGDFGPTLASEKMEEDDNILINKETLRLWLKEAGLWVRKRKHRVYRERRERRPCFGDLLQIDGSIHSWFGKEKQDCLLNMVDDATGITMAMLDTGETTAVLLKVLKRWIMKYGIPKAVYVDLKRVYVGSKCWMNKYDDDADEGFSVFQRVCKMLDIEIIRAYSPQAKGRVERKHGVFQDRLVKDIKLYGLTTIEEVNHYLETVFLDKINNKFAKPPKDFTDSHRDPEGLGNLDEIICWQYIRKLRNDWTIRFKNEYFQLEKTTIDGLEPEKEIIIKINLDNEIKFSFKNKRLKYRKLDTKPEPPSRSKKYYQPKGGQDPVQRRLHSIKSKSKSPWSQFNPNWLKSQKAVTEK